MMYMAKTQAKAKSKPSKGADQHERFVAMAAEVGADTKPGALDRAFGKIDAKQPPAKPAKPK
jgi:hypothetical protein